MIVLALQIIAAALAGLWVPVQNSPLMWVLPVGLLAWWFAGAPALLVTMVLCAAMSGGTLYRAEWRAVTQLTGNVLVSGCVADFPRANEYRTAFAFDTRHERAGSLLFPERVYVTIYDAVYPVRAGGCYDLLLRVKPAHGQGNRGQFDREIWLFRSGITATAYVRDSPLNRERHDLRPGARFSVRAALRARLIADHGGEATGLLRGLVLGDRSGISPAQWETLRMTGTTHLIAISGLHIGMVAAAVAVCVWWFAVFVRLSPAASAATAGSAAAFLYALLAGWSVPTSRAATMFVICAALWLSGRDTQPLRVLALVAISGVVVDPVVVLQPGFWMSYLAVALLLTGRALKLGNTSQITHKVLNYSISLLSAQWRLSIGLLVPGLLLFGVWAPVAPLINLVAIPLFSFVLLPLVMAASLLALLRLPGGDALVTGAGWLLHQSVGMLDAAIERSGSGLRMAPGPLALTLLLAGSVVSLVSRWLVLRVAGVLLLLAVLASPALWNWRPDRPELQVDVLDVGQGSAVLVQTRTRALLIDAGPAWRGGDSGAMTVVPAMQALGLSALDLLVISHSDNDHAGGADSVRQRLHAPNVMAPVHDGVRPHWLCRRAMRWAWDDVEFRILHPRTVVGWSRNDASCVLSVRTASAHVLLPGDIETDAEAVTLARGDELRADLVIVPHHGSRTSSSEAWVATVTPNYAVYTTGFRNRWGFPDSAVARRWAEAGSCGLNTALTGQLTFTARHAGRLTLDSVYKADFKRPAAVRYRDLPGCAGR